MSLESASSRSPAVSVLLPVRNGARFLDATLESLAAQVFGDFEIVVVDNGSTDGTAAIIARWARRDDRVRAFSFGGRGLARCLNFGAAQARAPLLARIDSDDLALPERLGRQSEAMAADAGLGLVGSHVRLIDAEGRALGEKRLLTTDADLRRFLARGNPFVHSAVMMRRSAFDAAGGYRDGLMLCEDYDLWLRLSEVSRVGNLDEVLAVYRIHPGGMSFGRPARLALANAAIVAGAAARRRGEPEPFDRGRPLLRAALRLTGQSRGDFRLSVLKATAAAARLAEAGQARALRKWAWRLFPRVGARNWPAALGKLVAMYSKPGGR